MYNHLLYKCPITFPTDFEIDVINPIYYVGTRPPIKDCWISVILTEIVLLINRHDLVAHYYVIHSINKPLIFQHINDVEKDKHGYLLWGLRLMFVDNIPETHIYCFSDTDWNNYENISLAITPPNFINLIKRMNKIKAFW